MKDLLKTWGPAAALILTGALIDGSGPPWDLIGVTAVIVGFLLIAVNGLALIRKK